MIPQHCQIHPKDAYVDAYVSMLYGDVSGATWYPE